MQVEVKLLRSAIDVKSFDESRGDYDLVDGTTTLTTGSYNNSPILNSMFIKDKKRINSISVI